MKTIEINLYKFDELSDITKQVAISQWREDGINYNWWNTTYEEAKNIGLKITGFDLDRNKHASGEFILDSTQVAQKILVEHGEHCDTYLLASAYLEKINEEPENDEQREEIEDEFLKDLLSEYANMLQEESEYLLSDEAIAETIEANDYNFTEDGKLY